MPTLAEKLRATVHRGRGIAGSLGFRTHRAYIVRRCWIGGAIGEGGYQDEETELTEGAGQPPKARWLTEEQLAVGGLPRGTVEVGPITPAFAGGGTDIATIAGRDLTRGEELLLKIVGPMHPNGDYYGITQVKAERALRYVIQGQPKESGVA
jgi:hypothetical protein